MAPIFSGLSAAAIPVVSLSDSDDDEPEVIVLASTAPSRGVVRSAPAKVPLGREADLTARRAAREAEEARLDTQVKDATLLEMAEVGFEVWRFRFWDFGGYEFLQATAL